MDTHTHTQSRPRQPAHMKISTFAGTHTNVNGMDGLTHVLCGCSGLKPTSAAHTQIMWSSPGQPCTVAGPRAGLAPDAWTHKPLSLRVPLTLFAGPQVSYAAHHLWSGWKLTGDRTYTLRIETTPTKGVAENRISEEYSLNCRDQAQGSVRQEH